MRCPYTESCRTFIDYHSQVARKVKKARRLVVDGKTFLWSVKHQHHVEQTEDALANRYRNCREMLTLRLYGTTGRLDITFAKGDGRTVSDGVLLPSGTVRTSDSGWLNLNEPGTARALLDEALARGWSPTATVAEHLDGWQLFDAAVQRRRK